SVSGDPIQEERRAMEGPNRWKMAVTIIILIAVALVCCVGFVAIDRAQTHNRRAFNRIRSGEEVEASSIEFTGQQQFTELTDPASVRCFMDALRSARPYKPGEDSFGGITYHVNIRLVRGDMFTVVVHVPDHNRGMTLYTDLEYLGINDPEYYYISFPDQIPEALAGLLERLR